MGSVSYRCLSHLHYLLKASFYLLNIYVCALKCGMKVKILGHEQKNPPYLPTERTYTLEEQVKAQIGNTNKMVWQNCTKGH